MGASDLTPPERTYEYVEGLFPEAASIKSDELRRQVIELWLTVWKRSSWPDLATMPVAPEIDESTAVGHARITTRIAISVADILEEFHGHQLDRDTLIAGALLMDVVKPIEYEPDGKGGAKKTRFGELFPHPFYGAALAVEAGLPLEVAHVMCTHSQIPPMDPATVEAGAVRFAGVTDAFYLLRDRMSQFLTQYNG